MQSPFLTRREFLRTGLIGGAVCGTLPLFLQKTLFSIEAAETASPLQRPDGVDAPILVLMQLAGGNDGLNTVIPLRDDHYARARPRLRSVAGEALGLNADFGLHPACGGLRELWDGGHLGIVHATGYPNPNRSHFRSTEIWHCGDSEARNGAHGWIGRYFDANCAGEAPEVGVSLTDIAPQIFSGEAGKGISFRDPRQFQFPDDDGENMAAMGGSEPEMAGASIAGGLGGAGAEPLDALSFLERSHLNAQVSSEQLHALLKRTETPKGFPDSRLGSDLRLVSQLIGGGLSTRVYYLSQGGYDTHANQANTHQRLLGDLSNGLSAFWREIARQGNTRRVCLLVFSEFGRRVAENSGQGTDHGAAAPVFVLGGGIRAGFHGQFPSLAPGDLLKGDVRHTTDFRQIYAALLKRHLAVDPEPLLGKAHAPLDLWA